MVKARGIQLPYYARPWKGTNEDMLYRMVALSFEVFAWFYTPAKGVLCDSCQKFEMHLPRFSSDFLRLAFQKYIMEHQQTDCLVEGFGRQSSNPFREKSSCQVL